MTEAFEEVFVQAFIPQPAVEAFDEAVLHRLAGGDEVPGHAAFPAPSEHGVGGKLRPVIRDDHAGLASKLDELIQLARNLTPEMDVSTRSDRHSRVQSSITASKRHRIAVPPRA